jgi:probable O-glycosylation ligase (exosortase A-associated)
MVFGSLPFILKRPHIGVLVWAWLSYMNPHRMTWSFAYNMPFAQIVALVLFVSLLFSKEKKTIPVDGMLVIWILFLVWITITTLFAIHPESAMEYYARAIKIQLLTFVTMMCMRDEKRIDQLIWVICLSIGFFTVKGGLFTLATAGQYRVYGPPQSFIGENNAMALASLIVLPLFYYLQFIAEDKRVKWGLRGSMLLTGISILGSQSRGAFIGILSLAGYFWLQSRVKFISGFVIVLLAAAALAFMPAKWEERMESIRNYQEDPSAMARITAWRLSINMANARLTGGGFNSYSQYTYTRYLEPVKRAFVAHSIYFQMLGSHGWPGLIMYLAILFMTWRGLGKVERQTRGDPELAKYNMLARMLTLSLVVFCAGGTFLSLAFFDLPWHVVAIAYLLKHQVRDKLAARAPPTPAQRRRARRVQLGAA